MHTRVHEKRHGPNFVPRRARRSTITHKIHRNENIIWRSTYLGEASESCDETGKTTDNRSLKMDPRNIREKILGTLHLYLHNLFPVTVLSFLVIFSNIEYARSQCQVLRNFVLRLYERFSLF